MIVVQIHSGLGNQLFMYAAARALANKRNTDLYLDVDTDCREGIDHGVYVGHSFQLDKFNIAARHLDLSALKEDASVSRGAVLNAVKTQLREIKVLRSAVRVLRHNGVDLSGAIMKAAGDERKFYREEFGDWKYKPEFWDLPDGITLRGCFFSYKYFDWMREQIVSELSLKNALSEKSRHVEQQIASSNSVSVHIRRGDVVTRPEYRCWYEGVVTEQYYRNAIVHFREKLRDPHFFVFSDDMEWVKKNFSVPCKVTYVDHNGPEAGFEDLHLMSKCRHNVTSGFSSFSWWGAYLNRNPEKIVVRTQRMNALDSLNHPQDFYPASWIVADS